MFLIFEASLIMGAGLLSWAGVLGQVAVYQFVTTLVACAVALGLWLVARHDAFPVKSLQVSAAPAEAIVPWYISTIGIAIFAAFAAAMLYLTLSAYPAVEDSLTIKLPKIVFAIEANSILPTHLTDDPRMYISPVYPALVQLFLVINGQTGHALLAFGFVNWIVCGFAVYQLCRDVGSSKFASWAATALVLLSPVLIVQGTSEGDDLMAATPFMISLIFLWAWLQRGGYPIVAGLGLGFAVGLKFLALFFLPAVPIVVLFSIIRYPWPQKKSWLGSRWTGAVALSAAFVFSLAPHLIANWVAFGNPLYVSPAVAATSNAPFSLDCGLRSVVGYTKNLIFSDFAHLLLSPAPDFGARLALALLTKIGLHIPYFSGYVQYVPKIPSHATLLTYSDAYQEFLSNVLPYNPIPVCSAYGQPFRLTSLYLTDNTLWYGVFGPFLLVSAFFAVFSRNQPLLLRALGLGFLVWVVAFAVSEKYLADIGRYWSVAVLAGSPTAAVLIDLAMRKGAFALARRSMVLAAGLMTVILAITVLSDNAHRSIHRNQATRYVAGFSPEFSTLMKSATAVNVGVAYGIDTYDYYMLMRRGAKLTNLASISPEALNVVVVRPAGLTDNVYSDPRVPVRMKRPFAGGFAYYGHALPQPGYVYNLAFVNNVETIEHADLSARSAFLLFQAYIRLEDSTIVGSMQQIAGDEIAGKIRFRIGWREQGEKLVMNDDWHRGKSADFRIPDSAVAIIVEAAFDDADNEGVAEWPIRGFDPGIAATLSQN
jgi:Dolichyl-phosphate-mannose-protein mannosyltransferase